MPIYSQQAPAPKFPNNCYRPRSDAEQRLCFVHLFNENQKRVREKKPKNKPPSDIAQQIEAERLFNEERRKQELDLIRERVERSRTRNISHKGKKYRITFGRVSEPTE